MHWRGAPTRSFVKLYTAMSVIIVIFVSSLSVTLSKAPYLYKHLDRMINSSERTAKPPEASP